MVHFATLALARTFAMDWRAARFGAGYDEAAIRLLHVWRNALTVLVDPVNWDAQGRCGVMMRGSLAHSESAVYDVIAASGCPYAYERRGETLVFHMCAHRRVGWLTHDEWVAASRVATRRVVVPWLEDALARVHRASNPFALPSIEQRRRAAAGDPIDDVVVSLPHSRGWPLERPTDFVAAVQRHLAADPYHYAHTVRLAEDSHSIVFSPRCPAPGVETPLSAPR